jgi:predicted phage terminase large subunit-like protein
MTTMTKPSTIRKRVESMSAAQRRQLAAMTLPRLVEPYTKHIPHPTQMVFLSLGKYREVMFGGAAGGGKSDALLMAALQYVDVPGYAALLLRKTWPDLVLPGAIMDRTRQWLEDTPARPKDGGRVWLFPSGARIQFGYLQHDAQKYRYQSAEFQFIGFDELTQWQEEKTYDYLFSRLRKPALACTNCGTWLSAKRNSASGARVFQHTEAKYRVKPYYCKASPDRKVLDQYRPSSDGTSIFDVPLRMRSATNPGGLGNEWVKARFIDPKTKRPRSIFVPSKLTDNPSLDPSYKESLSYLNEVDRQRLLEGDWDVTEAGEFFDRGDFIFIDGEPTNVIRRVRYWDKASTQGGGDWTVGTLSGILDSGKVVIIDVVRFQGHPHVNEKKVRATAHADGLDVYIREEQEPGSSGVSIIDHYRRNVVNGFMYDGIKSTGSKEARATAYAGQAKAGNILVCKALWNRDWLNEHEAFPGGAHDDQVDSAAGGFNFLTLGRRTRLIV